MFRRVGESSGRIDGANRSSRIDERAGVVRDGDRETKRDFPVVKSETSSPGSELERRGRSGTRCPVGMKINRRDFTRPGHTLRNEVRRSFVRAHLPRHKSAVCGSDASSDATLALSDARADCGDAFSQLPSSRTMPPREQRRAAVNHAFHASESSANIKNERETSARPAVAEEKVARLSAVKSPDGMIFFPRLAPLLLLLSVCSRFFCPRSA